LLHRDVAGHRGDGLDAQLPEFQASRRASASSIPGSVSITTGVIESRPAPVASQKCGAMLKWPSAPHPNMAAKEDGMHIRIKYCGE